VRCQERTETYHGQTFATRILRGECCTTSCLSGYPLHMEGKFFNFVTRYSALELRHPLELHTNSIGSSPIRFPTRNGRGGDNRDDELSADATRVCPCLTWTT